MVVAPPSQGPTGRYQFVQGALQDVAQLSPLQGLDVGRTVAKVDVGQRNDALWRHCMRAARHCDDLDALLDVARTFAEDALMVPLSEAEILKTARSAWSYEITGRNLFGRGRALILGHALVDELAASDPEAYALYSIVKRHNGGSDQPFMVANAMAESLGWNRKRLAAARAKLLELDLIQQVRSATSNRVALYKWGGRF